MVVYPQSRLLATAQQACSFLKAATAVLQAANAYSLSDDKQTEGTGARNIANWY